MATPVSVDNAAPTGVIAEYFGSAGGSTDRYYWIQAIYPSGRSLLTSSNKVTTIAGLDHNNVVLVQWNAMAGAIGYNVFYSTTTTIPTVGTNFLGTVTANAYTDNGGPAGAGAVAGQVIIDGVRYARARYDFAVDGGGAPGLITLAQSDTIPLGAIIVGGFIRVSTAFATATAVGVGTSAGSSATALIASTAIATLNGATGGVTTLVPTRAAPVRMTAAGTVTITSTVAALTAGVMDVFIEYVMSLS